MVLGAELGSHSVKIWYSVRAVGLSGAAPGAVLGVTAAKS